MPRLDPPMRIDQPYFAYGLFKEGELAFGRLRAFLSEPPRSASVSGRLWLRDGLPLLERGSGTQVSGSLLRFDRGRVAEAYATICEVEPRKHYRWEEVELMPSRRPANVLVGRSPRKGAVDAETGAWSSRDDPVFNWGLETVASYLRSDGDHPFRSAPPDDFDWPRFFRLQAAYLLLWSAVERFSALRFGPSLDPGERVDRLGGDHLFQEAVRRTVDRTARVVDSRDPRRAARLDPQEPGKAIEYYYRVRSNLSHRGKGAWKDGEIVRESLRELLQIFRQVLGASRTCD